eukprot:TRINITY_DN64767_c0_g1_i1.p1 TRINITY_DN64767_c0_g1~~TRINITY_DN64767_c0_g1_i1.p1  ORF type:complete len:109 (+),score=1.78 TRINITY_DN64767_c0_g1_i1:30-356(+)
MVEQSGKIHVVAIIHVKEGKRDEYLNIMKEYLPTIRKEKGCIRYDPTIDCEEMMFQQETDDNRIIMVEEWEKHEDLKAHLVAPHMKEMFEKVKDIGTGVQLNVMHSPA